MIRHENHCCDCAVPGYPCIHNECPRVSVPVYYCDYCGDDSYAKYEINGEHFCEEHAIETFKEMFEDLPISEQAEALKVSLKFLEG